MIGKPPPFRNQRTAIASETQMHPSGCGGYRGHTAQGFVPLVERTRRARWYAFRSSTSEVHLCAAGHVVEEGGPGRGLQIDPQTELVLELDEAADLTELLDVLLATEGGEHAREVALRCDGRPEPLAERLANRRAA